MPLRAEPLPVRTFPLANVPLSAPPQERVWTERRGLMNARYEVDARDPNHVYARIKIHLQGDSADVARIKALEPQIEASLNTARISVDVEFTDERKAFDVRVSAGWDVQNRWSPLSSAETYAHEIGHSLGLEDVYDLRQHCTNLSLEQPTREYWCREGERRAAAGILPKPTLMGNVRLKLSDEEVDQIAGIRPARTVLRPN